jgi:hypothetical protein
MKGLIWNCRGIRKSVSSFLRELILDHKFHFIGLQETMQAVIEDKTLRLIDPNQNYLWKWIPSKGRFWCILSGINLEFYDVGAFPEGKYILQLTLWDKHKKIKWNFLNVYGAPHEEDKADFLAQLALMCSKCKEPYIIRGDFNLIRFSSEKIKKAPTDILISLIL